jgi:hypothetical protein
LPAYTLWWPSCCDLRASCMVDEGGASEKAGMVRKQEWSRQSGDPPLRASQRHGRFASMRLLVLLLLSSATLSRGRLGSRAGTSQPSRRDACSANQVCLQRRSGTGAGTTVVGAVGLQSTLSLRGGGAGQSKEGDHRSPTRTLLPLAAKKIPLELRGAHAC